MAKYKILKIYRIDIETPQCLHVQVYDFRTREFRAGSPSDLVTIHVEYNAPTASNPEDRAKLNVILAKILPFEDVREYVLIALAQSLSGQALHKLVYFLMGKADSGKSALRYLVEVIMFANPCY